MLLQRTTVTTTHLLTSTTTCRNLTTDLTAELMFKEAWPKVAPNIDPPKLPINFMQPRPPIPGSSPPKLTLNFHLPYSSHLSNKQVDMVIVPATTGQMGILPGHAATITELKPGLLSFQEGNETTKFFISDGFAFVHSNSIADIIAVEAMPVDRIDPRLGQKGLAEFLQKSSSGSTDYEKAEAQIGYRRP